MRFRLPVLSALFLIPVSLLGAVAGNWMVDGARQPVAGEPRMEVTFPESAQLYLEPDRLTFRPERSTFEAGALELEAKVESDSPEPVQGVVFLKDKEGHWFQSIEEFLLKPGEWQKLSVRLDRSGRDWRGVGHKAIFDAEAATKLYDAGISVYGSRSRTFTLECRNLQLTGKREVQPLAVTDWKLPDLGEVNRRVDSRFRIAREFFNPFDPDEVTVDFDLQTPDGKVHRYPGFYSRDYERSRHFNREIITPVGSSFWEIRFTPAVPGEYRVRLVINDLRAKEETVTGWQDFTAAASNLPGAVRVSPKNNGYFELTSGEFFFPVSLNIHTNTDRRSEIGFKFGHLPDRGTYDYDDYFETCGKAGINTVEVWMAGWTMAIEHDAGRRGYYGVGRYNTDAAWRLDHVIDTARENGIFINLVIDNHGRISIGADPEWSENPLNTKGEYAAANGAFLDNPAEFFRFEAAIRNNSKRARYIAARWGATPNIMAAELWSEVDLTAMFSDRYNDESAVKWHQNAAAELRGWSQLDLPVATHICGEFRNVLKFIKLFQQPAITHLAGDAYRNPDLHFADHLRDYGNNMKENGKPQLITEYGGNPMGSAPEQILGDIHSGLWGSLFSRLSGTPFLWWHDFVLLNNHYDHYRAFADYLKGIDLRYDKVDYLPDPVLSVPAPPKDQTYQSMAVATPDAFYGWIYNRAATQKYPSDPTTYPEVKDVWLRLESGLPVSGIYRLRWFSTLPCRELSSQTVKVEQGKALTLTAPPFRIDVAFKLEREKK